jgi:hypothetical protein
MFTSLFGQRQQAQQQQAQKSDRQVADGYTRGNDDPDNRRTSFQGAQAMRNTVQTFREDTIQIRRELREREAEKAHAKENDSGYRPQSGEAFKAALEAAQRRFDAQQRQRNQGKGRGL